MRLSLGQAAKLAGVGKTTISRAIASGRLSATRKDDGGYDIDPAELSRVYDVRPERLERLSSGAPLDEIEADEDEDVKGEDRAEEARRRLEIMVLEEQIRSLRDLIQSEKERREAAEADRDRWHEQAAKATALLPPPAPANDPAETRKAGLLDRLFGRRSA